MLREGTWEKWANNTFEILPASVQSRTMHGCMKQTIWHTAYQLLPIPFVSYLHSLYHTVRTLSNVYQITIYDRILSASLKSLARNVPDRRSHSIEACSDKAEWLQMCFHDVWWKHLPSRALKFYISITLQWVTWLVLKLSWVLRSSYKNDMYTIHVPVGHGSEVSLLGIFFVWAHVPDDL